MVAAAAAPKLQAAMLAAAVQQAAKAAKRRRAAALAAQRLQTSKVSDSVKRTHGAKSRMVGTCERMPEKHVHTEQMQHWLQD